jgi:Tol biopolymer transport system component
LTVFPSPPDSPVSDPTWSPNGKKIAYNDFDNFSIVNADGSAPSLIYYSANSGCCWFAWSSDSSLMAYTRPVPDGIEDAIYLVSPDGDNNRMLTRGTRPAWSPDGKRIAFNRGGSVYTVSGDGTRERRLGRAETPTLVVSWSPDGDHVAYTAWTSATPKACPLVSRCDPGFDFEGKRVVRCVLGIMSSDGTDERRISTGGLRGDTEGCYASWSPDGRRVAFSRRGFLYTAASDGRDERRLVRGLRPIWAPVGSHIAFTRDGHIYAIREDGSGEQRLARGDHFSWSPHEASLVVDLEVKARASGVPGKYAIAVVRPDGSRRRVWPRVGYCDCGEAAWQGGTPTPLEIGAF